VKTDPRKLSCAQCNGSGEIAVVDASGKRVLVVCAGTACQAAAEARDEARAARRDSARTVGDIMAVILAPENIQRLLAKLLCHLPIEMSKGGKRG
jgi:uncharacterized heparinase superfamily protein